MRIFHIRLRGLENLTNRIAALDVVGAAIDSFEEAWVHAPYDCRPTNSAHQLKMRKMGTIRSDFGIESNIVRGAS
jgi:hypothetical protein